MPTPLRRIHRLNQVLGPVVDLLFAAFMGAFLYFGIGGVFWLYELLREFNVYL